MLVSEKMVFIELHKGGSTRVQKLVSDIGGGEQPGKVPTFANELEKLGKPVIGYVCDPLAWYLNAWKMGCAERGELYRRLTDRTKWTTLLAKRAARQKEGSTVPAGKAIPESWGAERAMKVWYAKTEEPEAFREWLQAVLATRGIRRLVHATFVNSPMQRLGGLLTYEFFLSFVKDTENMDKAVDSFDALKALYEQKGVTRHFIRAESAGADFVKVMGELGMPMTDGQVHTVTSWDKDHEAFREQEFATFYDDASRKLVLKRERFISELFGYQTLSAAEGQETEDDEDADKPGGGKGGKGKGGKGMAGKKGMKAGKKKGGGGGATANDDEAGDDEDNAAEKKPKLSPEERQEKREARQAAKAEAKQSGAAASGAAAGGADGGDEDGDDEGGSAAPKTAAAKKSGAKGGGGGGGGAGKGAGQAAGKAAGKSTGKTAGKTAGKAAGKSAGSKAGGKTGNSAGKPAGQSAEKSAAKKQSRTAAKAAAAKGQPDADSDTDESPTGAPSSAATGTPGDENPQT